MHTPPPALYLVLKTFTLHDFLAPVTWHEWQAVSLGSGDLVPIDGTRESGFHPEQWSVKGHPPQFPSHSPKKLTV